MREIDSTIKKGRKTRKTTNRKHCFPRYPNLVQELEIVRPDRNAGRTGSADYIAEGGVALVGGWGPLAVAAGLSSWLPQRPR